MEKRRQYVEQKASRQKLQNDATASLRPDENENATRKAKPAWKGKDREHARPFAELTNCRAADASSSKTQIDNIEDGRDDDEGLDAIEKELDHIWEIKGM